jgi:CRP-like cAMP-binding protein
MVFSELDRTANLLLRAMTPSDRALLQPHLTCVDIAREQVLVAQDQPIEYAYFLNGGIASVVSTSSGCEATEVGIFGRDGLSGIDLLLGSDRSPNDTFIQVDGTSAFRIGVDDLRRTVSQSRPLQTLLLRYAQTFMVQLADCAVSNARNHLEARLARWLLMCHDRTDGDEVLLTHSFMSLMIASQRTGVTLALHILEGEGVIRSQRGRVTILDREKLVGAAGMIYGRSEAEYRRLIGPFGKQFGTKPIIKLRA